MIIKPRFTIYFCSGGFLFIDQILKYQSLHNWSGSNLINKFFGWQPYINYGAAFGLPVPSWLIIIFTIPIILLVLYLLCFEKNQPNLLGYYLIFFGSLSNLFDRLYYGAVIDYWQLFTGIINLADGMIVGGLVMLLWINKKYYFNKSINYKKTF